MIENPIIEYQKFCPETFISQGFETDLLHCIAGMQAEAWEVSEKIYDGAEGLQRRDLIHKEIGDLCYYMAMTCNITFKSMAEMFVYWHSDNKQICDPTYYLSKGAGKLAGTVQKYHRGDFGRAELIRRSMEDMTMFMRAIGGLVEYSELLDILELNKQILLDRKERNQIQGDGDNR